MLESLREASPLSRSNLLGVPERGIYVFYEIGRPLYVGRSNRLRQRLQEHSRPGSPHNSAAFAFNLAIRSAREKGLGLEGLQRTQLENDTSFARLFAEAKTRVAAMEIRIIEITDPIEQTVFEVYAALALDTPYNDFDNH